MRDKDYLAEGLRDWVTYSNNDVAKDIRRYHDHHDFKDFFFLILHVVAGYLAFTVVYDAYGAARDFAIRQIYIDKVQIVELETDAGNNDAVLAEFRTYWPVATAETYLKSHGYNMALSSNKGVRPANTWSNYCFGQPAYEGLKLRRVFTKDRSIVVVLVDYGDDVVYDLNLGRTTQDSPFHETLFKQVKASERADFPLPRRSYFR